MGGRAVVFFDTPARPKLLLRGLGSPSFRGFRFLAPFHGAESEDKWDDGEYPDPFILEHVLFKVEVENEHHDRNHETNKECDEPLERFAHFSLLTPLYPVGRKQVI